MHPQHIVEDGSARTGARIYRRADGNDREVHKRLLELESLLNQPGARLEFPGPTANLIWLGTGWLIRGTEQGSCLVLGEVKSLHHPEYVPACRRATSTEGIWI